MKCNCGNDLVSSEAICEQCDRPVSRTMSTAEPVSALSEQQIDAAQFCLSEFFPKIDGVTLRIAAKETVEAAMDAALSEPVNVTVKPLEWKLVHDCWLAECIGHAYEVHNDEMAEYKKRQCQFDFTARSLSALSHVQAPAEVVEEEMCPVCGGAIALQQIHQWEMLALSSAKNPAKKMKPMRVGAKYDDTGER